MKNLPQTKSHWHLVYYLLAAFNLLVIGTALYLNHSHLNDYANLVQSNTEVMSALKSASELLNLAQKANAPGNDIFDTHDVIKEKTRYHKENIAFDKHLITLHELLHSMATTEEEKSEIKNQITNIQSAMNHMREVATEIFTYF